MVGSFAIGDREQVCSLRFALVVGIARWMSDCGFTPGSGRRLAPLPSTRISSRRESARRSRQIPARLAVAERSLPMWFGRARIVRSGERSGSVSLARARQADSPIGAGQEVQEGLFDCNGPMCVKERTAFAGASMLLLHDEAAPAGAASKIPGSHW